MHFDDYPSYTELRDLLESMVLQNNDVAFAETIGYSPEGREVRAIHITDRETPIEKKEIALVICGRHGDELGTRVVGPFLMEWLCSEKADSLLKQQYIILVPIANPDGCAKMMFGLPPDRLSKMEQQTILRIARKLVPDVVIDVHSLGKKKYGYHWGGLQAVVIDPKADSGEDRFIVQNMACQMIQSVCDQGYHYLLHDVDFYQNLSHRAKAVSDAGYNDHINKACYNAFHSLTFGVEVNHFFYSPDVTGQSGKNIIRALLLMGNRLYPWEYYPGFPNRLLGGDFLSSIRARGASAGERRRSRHEIWQNIDGFVKYLAPYRKTPSKHTIEIICKYSGGCEIKQGVTFCVCIENGVKLKNVRVNAKSADYQIKETPCCQHVFVDVEKLAPADEKNIFVEF
ncbi:M14 family zinc carboxypeptidase [Thermodesulfobacteriota bacterium]